MLSDADRHQTGRAAQLSVERPGPRVERAVHRVHNWTGVGPGDAQEPAVAAVVMNDVDVAQLLEGG